MFDEQTIQLLSELPIIEDMNGESARAHLTEAYLELIRLRVSTADSLEPLPQAFDEIRQMANGLELFCLIEFAREGELLRSGRAAAFVAAQSLELLAELALSEPGIQRHALTNPQTLSLVESGLLYLIAGYYANAAASARKLLPSIESSTNAQNYHEIRQAIANNVLGLLVGLLELDVETRRQYSVNWPNTIGRRFSQAPSDLSASAEGRLLSQLGSAVQMYLAYLSGEDNDFGQSAIDLVTDLVSRISEAMLPDSTVKPPSESLMTYHLASLLEIVFTDLKGFSTVHNMVPPSDADENYKVDFRKWLHAKAKRRHALLWHSTKKWLSVRHDEDAVHTVVSMPTGSGKSFMAEIALVERLHKGWGLYLAPMNALVHQIRQDLERELKEIGVKKVYRFLTDEHTTLEDEIFTGASTREIVVMTPEKALLAIRLRPEAFKKCSVCIFDECHIISKEDRGAVSDDFMARFIAQAPDAHIMLMSAMLQNPDKLADWLQSVTGKVSRPIPLNWKPTRSLRTLATIPDDQIKEALQETNAGKCNVQLIGQASIAWQGRGDSLYIDSLLPVAVNIRGNYKNVQWGDSVNDAARQIGIALVKQQVPTLVFLNSNATHIWTHAGKSPHLNWHARETEKLEKARKDVDAWLELAESELGSSSPLREYYQKGVTVHSGALIDEERRAAEIAYKRGLVGLMIATGTLAQGLNFPSQAVVMAGIEGSPFVGKRSAEDILNALGRSGRAGFYNIGLSILVPKTVLRNAGEVSIEDQAPKYLELLRKEDACLDATSALKNKVDELIAAAISLDMEENKHPESLETATLILSTTEGNQDSFFRYSYAAYTADIETYVDNGIEAARKLVKNFMISSGCPEWMPELAQRAGLSVAWLSAMHEILEESVVLDDLLIARVDFQHSMSIFQQIIKRVPPIVIVDKFGADSGSDEILRLSNLPKKLRNKDLDWSVKSDPNSIEWQSQWDEVFNLLNSWIAGIPFTQIANEFFGLKLPASRPLFPGPLIQQYSRSDRNPLNRAIKSIKELSYPLRHISSGFVLLLAKMLLEQGLIEEEKDIPLAIGMLPQAIHWGVDRLDKAFWYYNLLPVRCVAHACADAFPVTYQSDVQIKAEITSYASTIRSNLAQLLSGSSVSTEARNILSATSTLLGSS